MSRNWQLITGWDWTKRNQQAPVSTDPNTVLYGGNQHYAGWSYKLLGTYVLPKGIELSGIYNAQKGEPHNRQTQFTGAARNMLTATGAARTTNLAQGSTTVTMEPAGTYFSPTGHLTNLRAKKNFRITERQRIEANFDLFNIFNANTVTGVETLSTTTSGTNTQAGQTVQRFLRAQSIINPRIFRLGMRYVF